MKTDISMTRGDTQFFTIKIVNEKREKIPFNMGDTVYFTIKTATDTNRKTIQKVITDFNLDGEAEVEILPEDTRLLQFKDYVYDVQYTKSDGQVITIIKPSKFIILPEVTYE